MARDVRGLTEFRERRRREKRREKMRRTGERRDKKIKTKIFVVCGKKGSSVVGRSKELG